jgi:nickel/cobalt exporter
MTQLIFGSILLSLLHAAIPSHWLPLALIARTENWTRAALVRAAALTALAHTAGTVALGLAIGLVGVEVAERHEARAEAVGPAALVVMGAVYLFLGGRHRHSHAPPKRNARTRAGLVLALALSMFLSPCIEIMAFYFTAGTLGWAGLAAVSAVYLTVTVLGMTALSALAYGGLRRLNWHALERHEKRITGLALVVLGVLSLLYVLLAH